MLVTTINFPERVLRGALWQNCGAGALTKNHSSHVLPLIEIQAKKLNSPQFQVFAINSGALK